MSAGFSSPSACPPPVYYASKAFVISLSEAIAHELRNTGVTVTCHCPGATATEFATTAQNADSKLFKAGVADAAAVAEHGYRAMMKGRVLSIAGPMNWLGAQSVRWSPRPIVRSLAAWVNSK
jgi:short-subunit dehydrogenase